MLASSNHLIIPCCTLTGFSHLLSSFSHFSNERKHQQRVGIGFLHATSDGSLDQCSILLQLHRIPLVNHVHILGWKKRSRVEDLVSLPIGSRLVVQCKINSMCEQIEGDTADWDFLVERLFRAAPVTLGVVTHLWSIALQLNRANDDNDQRTMALQSSMRTLTSKISESSWIELEPFFEQNASFVVGIS